jgi:hypothetical protein
MSNSQKSAPYRRSMLYQYHSHPQLSTAKCDFVRFLYMRTCDKQCLLICNFPICYHFLLVFVKTRRFGAFLFRSDAHKNISGKATPRTQWGFA